MFFSFLINNNIGYYKFVIIWKRIRMFHYNNDDKNLIKLFISMFHGDIDAVNCEIT